MDTERTLKRYIVTELMLGQDESVLSSEDSLIDEGVIDSMGLLQLIEFVETEFGIEVPPEDWLPENFETVLSLNRYIQGKQELALAA